MRTLIAASVLEPVPVGLDQANRDETGSSPSSWSASFIAKPVSTLAGCALALMAGAPALADTLQEVTAKGIVLSVQGMDIDVAYTPDGKFTAMDGQVTGTWRIDGDKLCTSSNFDPNETCVAYPHDKKSGDTFEVTGPQGPATIRIK
jgi:hypothetical protein